LCGEEGDGVTERGVYILVGTVVAVAVVITKAVYVHYMSKGEIFLK
jgi:hypothetical protein